MRNLKTWNDLKLKFGMIGKTAIKKRMREVGSEMFWSPGGGITKNRILKSKISTRNSEPSTLPKLCTLTLTNYTCKYSPLIRDSSELSKVYIYSVT